MTSKTFLTSLAMLLIIVALTLTNVSAVQTSSQTGSSGNTPTKQENSFHQGAGRVESMRRENSRMPDMARSFSTIVNKVSSYVTSTASSASTLLTYPYYGISTGVTTVLVVCVVIFILVLVSGTVVTTGRSLGAPLALDHEDLDRLTHYVTTAVDLLAEKLADGRSGDLTKDDGNGGWKDFLARKLGGSSGGGPAWTATVSAVDSVSEYLSAHFYDKLIWLSKPYAGYILSLGAVILYMVIIVIVVMTSDVFPISTSGRQLHESSSESSKESYLIQAADTVMAAITAWEQRTRQNDHLKNE